MRLFTAIDIPAGLTEVLRSFVSRLRPTAKISWSPVENLHVTTKFIGEWPEARLDEMTRTLASVQAAGPIEIAVKGLGWFPNERRPRVFWAGVEGGEALRGLARATEEAVAELGVPVEKRDYSPHLTLARIRETAALDRLRQELESLPSGCGFDFGSFHAAQFFLYLSAGGRYTQLAGFPLA
ncbi:MAG: RNA 2',3'-cyclic phosphodiesterase [Acidobacteriota bacterium]|nr:RNA 2',3'-cyclic phosphodiesterase [Acidobacteriota bacterium]